MKTCLGRALTTIVRSIEALRQLLASDSYADFPLETGAKRVVTFLRGKPKVSPKLPIDLDGATILRMRDDEVFSAYVRSRAGRCS